MLYASDVVGAPGAEALPDGVALDLAATADAPALARQAARRALAHWDAAAKDIALLVISELVTNAVRHGSASPGDVVGLRVQRRGGATRIEVSDSSGNGAVAVPDGSPLHREDARSGWGLPIVAELTDRWGVEHRGACTCVWCELDMV